MPCTRPRQAWFKVGGGITFKMADAYTDRPLTFKCDQCGHCRLRRKREWALRAMHEMQMCDEACFITLTHSPDRLPEDRSVRLEDWQEFIKRLRKQTGKSGIRYLACGEYGKAGPGQHPHYHAVLFGHDFADRTYFGKSNGYPIYISQELSKAWQYKGFVTIGQVSFDSCAYVAGYVMKKVTGDQASEHYLEGKIDDETGEVFPVLPEFAAMSRRPGLGADWFERYYKDVFPSDFVVHAGKKYPVPRYYDKLLERKDPEMWDAVRKERIRAAVAAEDELTYERLRTKEKVLEAKMVEKEKAL